MEDRSIPSKMLGTRSLRLMAAGLIMVLAAAVGLIILQLSGSTQQTTEAAGDAPTRIAASSTPSPTATRPAATTPTPPAQAVIERQMLPIPSDTPPPSATPTATYTPILWSQAEKNALSWMCYGEVGGMLEVKVDACLSVLSTARVLDFYYNAPGSDILGVLARAFYVPVYTDRPGPDPDLNWAVEAYANGARGSCSGYMYFNSSPGGPSLCVIRSSNGSWVEFHNGW
jgi:hypothetical protein